MEVTSATVKSGLQLPSLPSEWVEKHIPVPPNDFMNCLAFNAEPTLLKDLNHHIRDDALVFEASTHSYYVNNQKTAGSVTGLVHDFAYDFDADNIASRMRSGNKWPRPGYLRIPFPVGTVEALKAYPSAVALVSALEAAEIDEEQICSVALSCSKADPVLNQIVDNLTLSHSEILEKWECNRIEAANRGTYMHLTFELYLNQFMVSHCTPELRTFLNFVATLSNLRAFRTEWMIYADAENLNCPKYFS
jgi:hypothetical protein